jgi:hypothetical protein
MFDQPTAVPARFDLVIPSLGDTYAAAHRWSHGTLVGVEFTDAFPRRIAESLPSAGQELGALLQAAQAENARLRRAIADAHRQTPPSSLPLSGTSQAMTSCRERFRTLLKGKGRIEANRP